MAPTPEQCKKWVEYIDKFSKRVRDKEKEKVTKETPNKKNVCTLTKSLYFSQTPRLPCIIPLTISFEKISDSKKFLINWRERKNIFS